MPPDQLDTGPTSGGGGGPGLLDTVLTGIGDILTGTVTTAAGNLLGTYLSKLLIDIGAPAEIANAFSTTFGQSIPSWLNAGPALVPGRDLPLIGGFGGPGTKLPSPYDPGGLLGFGDIGAIGAMLNSGLSGQVAGDFLKRGRVKVSDLLAHSHGASADILQKVIYGVI